MLILGNDFFPNKENPLIRFTSLGTMFSVAFLPHSFATYSASSEYETLRLEDIRRALKECSTDSAKQGAGRVRFVQTGCSSPVRLFGCLSIVTPSGGPRFSSHQSRECTLSSLPDSASPPARCSGHLEIWGHRDPGNLQAAPASPTWKTSPLCRPTLGWWAKHISWALWARVSERRASLWGLGAWWEDLAVVTCAPYPGTAAPKLEPASESPGGLFQHKGLDHDSTFHLAGLGRTWEFAFILFFIYSF